MSVKLTLRHFKKYSQTTFEFRSGTTFISGAGRAGKTTLFKSISWCLYKNGKDISPWDQPNAKTRVRLEITSMDLTITRTKNPTGFLVRHRDDKFEDEVAQAYIVNLFGTYDVWRSSCYLSGKKNRILSLPDKARSKLLEELFLSATPEELLQKIAGQIAELETKKATLLGEIDVRKRKILRKFANLETYEASSEEIESMEADLQEKQTRSKKLEGKLLADDQAIATKKRLTEELKALDNAPKQLVDVDSLQKQLEELQNIRNELNLLSKIAALDKKLSAQLVDKTLELEPDLISQRNQLQSLLLTYRSSQRDLEIWRLKCSLQSRLDAIVTQNSQKLVDHYRELKQKQKQYELYTEYQAVQDKLRKLTSNYDIEPEQIGAAIASKLYQEQLKTLEEALGSWRDSVDDILASENEFQLYAAARATLSKLALTFEDIPKQQSEISLEAEYRKHYPLYRLIRDVGVSSDVELQARCKKIEGAIAYADTYQCPCCDATLKLSNKKLVQVVIEQERTEETVQDVAKLQKELDLLRKISSSGVSIETVLATCSRKPTPKLTLEQVNAWINIKPFAYSEEIVALCKKYRQLTPAPLVNSGHSISSLKAFEKAYRSLKTELASFDGKDVSAVEDSSSVLTELKETIKQNHEAITEKKSLQSQLASLPDCNSVAEQDYAALIATTQLELNQVETKLKIVSENRIKYEQQLSLKSQREALQLQLQKIDTGKYTSKTVEIAIENCKKKIQSSINHNAQCKIAVERAASIKIELSRLSIENVRDSLNKLQISVKKLEGRLEAARVFLAKEAYHKKTQKLEVAVQQIVEDIGEYNVIAEIASTSKREIIEANLANVNNCLSEISQVFMEDPIRVSLSMFYKTIKSEIRNKVTVEAEYNGELRNIKALCGTEKSTISVILTAALCKTNSFPMLLVDEYIAKCDLEVRDNIVAHMKHILPKKAILLAYHGGSLGEFDHTLQVA